MVTSGPARWEAEHRLKPMVLPRCSLTPCSENHATGDATGEEDLCICCRCSVHGGVICMLVHDWLHISRREVNGLKRGYCASRVCCHGLGCQNEEQRGEGLLLKTPDWSGNVDVCQALKATLAVVPSWRICTHRCMPGPNPTADMQPSIQPFFIWFKEKVPRRQSVPVARFPVHDITG
jgi:hypothetical protein